MWEVQVGRWLQGTSRRSCEGGSGRSDNNGAAVSRMSSSSSPTTRQSYEEEFGLLSTFYRVPRCGSTKRKGAYRRFAMVPFDIQESNSMMGRWGTVARQTGLANRKVVGAKTRTQGIV